MLVYLCRAYTTKRQWIHAHVKYLLISIFLCCFFSSLHDVRHLPSYFPCNFSPAWQNTVTWYLGFYEVVIVTERLEKSWCACLDLQNVTDNLRVLGFDYKCHYKHTQIEYMTDVDMNKSQYIFEDFFLHVYKSDYSHTDWGMQLSAQLLQIILQQ